MTTRKAPNGVWGLWGRWSRHARSVAVARPEPTPLDRRWSSPQPLVEVRRFVRRAELEGEFFRDLM